MGCDEGRTIAVLSTVHVQMNNCGLGQNIFHFLSTLTHLISWLIHNFVKGFDSPTLYEL